LKGDADVVNCIQSHPHEACIASSGIESVVRLWSPTGEKVDEEEVEERIESNLEAIRSGTRHYFVNRDHMLLRARMILDDVSLVNSFRNIRSEGATSDDESDNESPVNCRMT